MEETKEIPVLCLAENACRLTGKRPADAFSLNLEFHRMLKAFNGIAFEIHGRRYRELGKHRTPLSFLGSEQDQLDPNLGLFKVIHLLDIHVHNVTKRPKAAERLSGQITKLIQLARHYQGRRAKAAGSNGAAMIQALEQHLTHVGQTYGRAIAPIRAKFPSIIPFPASEAPPPAC